MAMHFANGANVMAWETVAAVTMIILAVVFFAAIPKRWSSDGATVPRTTVRENACVQSHPLSLSTQL